METLFFDINLNDLIINFFKKKVGDFIYSIKKNKKNSRYDNFNLNKKKSIKFDKIKS